MRGQTDSERGWATRDVRLLRLHALLREDPEERSAHRGSQDAIEADAVEAEPAQGGSAAANAWAGA
jgi:hypothetical protein